jgi:hypothetical protein
MKFDLFVLVAVVALLFATAPHADSAGSSVESNNVAADNSSFDFSSVTSDAEELEDEATSSDDDDSNQDVDASLQYDTADSLEEKSEWWWRRRPPPPPSPPRAPSTPPPRPTPPPPPPARHWACEAAAAQARANAAAAQPTAQAAAAQAKARAVTAQAALCLNQAMPCPVGFARNSKKLCEKRPLPCVWKMVSVQTTCAGRIKRLLTKKCYTNVQQCVSPGKVAPASSPNQAAPAPVTPKATPAAPKATLASPKVTPKVCKSGTELVYGNCKKVCKAGTKRFNGKCKATPAAPKANPAAVPLSDLLLQYFLPSISTLISFRRRQRPHFATKLLATGAYAAFAVFFLKLPNEVTAQVMYTHVTPWSAILFVIMSSMRFLVSKCCRGLDLYAMLHVFALRWCSCLW